MRINHRTRYPHPVLSVDTQDFPDGRFEVVFNVDEDPVQNKLILECKTVLVENQIEQLLNEGSVAFGVDVRCGDTYYSRIHAIEVTDTTIEFKPGELSGRVSLRPLIWTCDAVDKFSSPGLHQEYSGAEFDLESGTLLAWDIEQVVHVGRKKLAPMDSIFALAKSDDLKDGQIMVALESEKIQIFASKKTFEHIHTMRQQGEHQAVLLNGVYLPALMQVLVYIRESREFDDLGWYQTFKAKCDFYNLDLDNPDILENAQTLLQLPYLKIEANFSE